MNSGRRDSEQLFGVGAVGGLDPIAREGYQCTTQVQAQVTRMWSHHMSTMVIAGQRERAAQPLVWETPTREGVRQTRARLGESGPTWTFWQHRCTRQSLPRAATLSTSFRHRAPNLEISEGRAHRRVWSVVLGASERQDDGRSGPLA